jgi:hypothetical protein
MEQTSQRVHYTLVSQAVGEGPAGDELSRVIPGSAASSMRFAIAAERAGLEPAARAHPSRLIAPGLVSQIRWRAAEAASEVAVEGGEVAKPGVERYLADGESGAARIDKQAMREGKALLHHEFAE